MAAEEKVAAVVSCHTWNKDCTMLAISPNNEEVWIYKCVGEDVKKWERKYILKEHGGLVSGIDWCPQTNLLATCGHDRNAYVWKYDEKGDNWNPTLVILRIDRAATSIKWSPVGNKFAVTSGAKCVPICQFEASSNWWISKMIKKHKSTVISLAWCCNNKFVVTGSCDNKVRIFSAYIAGLDSPDDDGFGEVWSKQHEFGEVLAEIDCGAWVNSVAWSPDGFRIAFAGHNSTLSFVQILAGSEPLIQRISMKGLPFLDIRFLGNATLMAVGFDNSPLVYSVQSGQDSDPQWGFTDQLDGKEVKADDKAANDPAPGAKPAAAAAGKGPGQFAKGFEVFKNSVNKGVAVTSIKKKETSAPPPAEKNTRHSNAINSIFVNPTNSNLVWTSAIDGRILQWNLKALKVNIK